MIDVKSTALMQYLHRKSDLYYGKALELGSEIQGWLEYIPQTFPHYTRHTIGHSEAIISQISKFMFRDDEGNDPVLNLSSAEAYILVAAAYLHDAGMVAADSEKTKILEEEEWQNWTTGDGGAADRWKQIGEFRTADAPADEAVRHFLADLETRYLLAEYVRRVHHERAGDVIVQHESSLGRFAFLIQSCKAQLLRFAFRTAWPAKCSMTGSDSPCSGRFAVTMSISAYWPSFYDWAISLTSKMVAPARCS